MLEVVRTTWDENIDYWTKFKITQQTLNRYGVVPIKTVYLNDNLYARSTKSNPIYAYLYPSSRLKIYRPLSPKKGKWYGNANMSDVGGIQVIDKGVLCFITSSLKDVMVLHELGFPAVCFNTEVINPKNPIVAETVRSLKKKFRFVVSFMDNDEAGLRANLAMSREYGIPYVSTVGPKDISDYIRKYAKHRTFKFIKKRLVKKFRQDNVPY
jgi:hypothetical protein